MKRYLPLLFLVPALLLNSCRNQEREQQLAAREQALTEKEARFALKEAEYQSLLRMRDSLTANHDTIAFLREWPADIAGQWSSKLICTESTCPDYVIGDQRNDVWEFSSDSTRIITKVINNNKLVRVYNAAFADNQINLSFKTDSASAKQVEMSVLLNEISRDKIKGTRNISVDNKCAARFSVELSRITN
ncbi:hypothetical protein [Arsenicibacter rosenii]|uniref:Uncharacterized protein n=1 Tax=Arsenicibacter rosenii TaxID=1750698 RepID=A0A1S2VRY4_9BACT|nr:hypothetical protein [Arsenicibacter rosenii]OIN61250.1 hypothetical protein BLX24_00855 [Arsenicibacter rosenii]